MTVIRFDHVTKQFTLHKERSRSFQELFVGLVHLRRGRTKERYLALRDVSFEVQAGEMLGIIGPNGAGKSTILKLISRIIEPTAGEIEIDGRVGALLELGSGFHPDLTGRENVYLNGSILGFSHKKMDRILDDIVDFSEMSPFIDVPVKHYSSGMYMRLGFSIAIHVEPNILLVDEVLAVGDQAFQHRCLDRINKMRRQGITIILVTHSLDTVRDMCDRAIWLDDGEILAKGDVGRVLELYADQVRAADEQALLRAGDGVHTKPRLCVLNSWMARDGNGVLSRRERPSSPGCTSSPSTASRNPSLDLLSIMPVDSTSTDPTTSSPALTLMPLKAKGTLIMSWRASRSCQGPTYSRLLCMTTRAFTHTIFTTKPTRSGCDPIQPSGRSTEAFCSRPSGGWTSPRRRWHRTTVNLQTDIAAESTAQAGASVGRANATFHWASG
jgi:ABC-type polysaccharide/polyol phosphate transport system ATPase subunit